MNQLISVTVRGKSKTWAFNFRGDPKYLAEWRADGLKTDEVLNTIPVWAHELGLTPLWFAAQNAWRWLRLW
jgi:hypothetical protein